MSNLNHYITLCFNERAGIGMVMNEANAALHLFDYDSLISHQGTLRNASAGQRFTSPDTPDAMHKFGNGSLSQAVPPLEPNHTAEHWAVTGGSLDRHSLEQRTLAAVEKGAQCLIISGSASHQVINSKGFEQATLHCHVVFNDLRFEQGNFSQLKSSHGLVFCNCEFSAEIGSFKNSQTQQGLVFIGCNFSQLEGLSLRGVQASELLLVGQTAGPSAMLWANDLLLSGSIKLEGQFPCSVHLSGKQAADSQAGNIGGDIVLGNHADSTPSDQPSLFGGRCVISDYRIGGGIFLSTVAFRHLSINHNQLDAENGIALQTHACDIHSNLKVEDNSIGNGLIQLNDCDIDRSLILRRNTLATDCRLDIHDCTAADALFEPVEQLYGAKNHWLKRLIRPRFKLLARETNKPKERRQLLEEYMRLKLWLANGGELAAEDVAFYNRQRLAGDSRGERALRWLITVFFGWGVRLSHLLTTSALVIIAFAGYYLGYGFEPLQALALSVQGFFNAIVSSWPIQQAGSNLAWAVVIEAALGVVLTTTLVGAYLRKLLR